MPFPPLDYIFGIENFFLSGRCRSFLNFSTRLELFFGRIITASLRELENSCYLKGSVETVIQKKREKWIPDRQVEIPRIVKSLPTTRVFRQITLIARLTTCYRWIVCTRVVRTSFVIHSLVIFLPRFLPITFSFLLFDRERWQLISKWSEAFAVFIDNNKIKSLNRLRMIKLFDKKKVFGWSTTAFNYFDDICFMLDTFARM